MFVTFANPRTGQIKTVKAGFSWVLFLFSPFYGIPLFLRGLHVHGLLVALIGLIASVVPMFSDILPIAGLGLIIAMFYYGINGSELTMAQLERSGWIRTDAPPPRAFASAIVTDRVQPASTDATAAMDDKPCPQCAESVKAAATVCRFCGYSFIDTGYQPKAMSVWKILGIGLAIVVGLFALAVAVGIADGVQEASDQPSDDAIAAEDIASDFSANSDAAELKYGNRTLRVRGTITVIKLDETGKAVIGMSGGFSEYSLTVFLEPQNKDAALELVRGQTIVVTCNQLNPFLDKALFLNQCNL